MKYGHPESEEAKAAEQERQRAARAIERREWRQYQRLYERCKAIAEAVWTADLERAAAQQQTLAEQMRDRVSTVTMTETMYNETDGPIPVPLFTPRDRLQFLKEATANLMIGTERRGLRAEFPGKDGEPNGEPAKDGEPDRRIAFTQPAEDAPPDAALWVEVTTTTQLARGEREYVRRTPLPEAASGTDEGEAQDVGLAPSGVVTEG